MNEPIACYIDDKEDEAKINIKRLNRVGGLQVKYVAPTPDLSLADIPPETQLFFVDWQLDTKVNYMGGTFASILQEKFKDYPIILITVEDILNSRARNKYIKSLIFNRYIPKGEIIGKANDVVAQSLELIKGFEILREKEKTWNGLMEVLVAKDNEKELLGEASPPLFKFETETSWSTGEIAKWIQGTLLEFPGILYDSLHAATFLGITEKDFCEADVQEYFKDAQYSGAIKPLDGRWWKGRLRDKALDIIDEANLSSTSVNKGFAPAFSKVKDRPLQYCTCNTSGKQPADWVCFILKEPVLVT